MTEKEIMSYFDPSNYDDRIEKFPVKKNDPDYFGIASKRIEKAIADKNSDLTSLFNNNKR